MLFWKPVNVGGFSVKLMRTANSSVWHACKAATVTVISIKVIAGVFGIYLFSTSFVFVRIYFCIREYVCIFRQTIKRPVQAGCGATTQSLLPAQVFTTAAVIIFIIYYFSASVDMDKYWFFSAKTISVLFIFSRIWTGYDVLLVLTITILPLCCSQIFYLWVSIKRNL